jgi:adenosylcobinamide-GDP ribazoletransferase
MALLRFCLRCGEKSRIVSSYKYFEIKGLTMLQQIKLFLTAVQFFTRLPVPAWVGHSAQQLDQAARYFPLVGVCVGGLAAGIFLLSTIVFPLTLAVALSMVGSVLITAAFHEDGLSDFVDGIGGGYTRDKMLAIMKDSRVGAYGVIALVFALLVKFLAIQSLANTHELIWVASAMLAAHTVSRFMALSIMLTQQYIRDDELARAKPAAQNLSWTSFFIALLTAMFTIFVTIEMAIHPINIGTALVFALLMRIYLARLILRNLGGYTGDCLGAVQQLTEIGFYLGLLVAW